MQWQSKAMILPCIGLASHTLYVAEPELHPHLPCGGFVHLRLFIQRAHSQRLTVVLC